jgi:NAD(P)-dependent dehydrogenase (short-subunit alcohol dehydrogenase family)
MKKTVFVTGANRGIGEALTKEFLRHGWHVFAGMRNPEKAPSSLSTTTPGRLEILALDVTSQDSVAKAVEAVRKSTVTLQILVNNAGIFPEEGTERLADMQLDWFRQAFETNVVSVVGMIQQFRPLLTADSQIVNISSGAGSISIIMLIRLLRLH